MYTNKRSSIGRGKPAPVPDWLDYTLSLQLTLVLALGGGELANNGVHALDIAR